MSERSWMPMYWGDYVKDTLHLNTFQHGCYMLLIAAYWIRGGPLPHDSKYLAQVCRTTQDKLARYGNPVLAMFTCKDGLLVHKRIEQELLRCSARSATARANARSSRATITITKKESESEESVTSIVPSPKPKARRKEYPEAFQQFWLAYPKRGTDTKADAFKAWDKARQAGTDEATLQDGAERYAAFAGSTGCETKHVQTWINREGWTASYAKPNGNGAHHGRQPSNQRASVVEAVRRFEQRLEDRQGLDDDAARGQSREH